MNEVEGFTWFLKCGIKAVDMIAFGGISVTLTPCYEEGGDNWRHSEALS